MIEKIRSAALGCEVFSRAHCDDKIAVIAW